MDTTRALEGKRKWQAEDKVLDLLLRNNHGNIDYDHAQENGRR